MASACAPSSEVIEVRFSRLYSQICVRNRARMAPRFLRTMLVVAFDLVVDIGLRRCSGLK